MEKVLITGIAGGLGRLLAARLCQTHQVCGVDLDSWLNHPPGIGVRRADLRKRNFEDAIRTEQQRVSYVAVWFVDLTRVDG